MWELGDLTQKTVKNTIECQINHYFQVSFLLIHTIYTLKRNVYLEYHTKFPVHVSSVQLGGPKVWLPSPDFQASLWKMGIHVF
jgi:hypothetical protein